MARTEESAQIERALVEEYQARFSTSHPHILKRDFELLIVGAVDNYFSRDGIRRWLDKTVPGITPEVLRDEIRSDRSAFLYFETHLAGEGYIPLAERNREEVVA